MSKPTLNIQQLQKFFATYADLKQKVENPLSVEAVRRLPVFFSEFKSFSSRVRDYHKTYTPHYNLFKVLRIPRLETRTHTPFLVNLLDPDGTHAQGTLFIQDFCHHVLKLPSIKGAISVNEVRENRSTTDGGFIDIFLRLQYYGKPFAVVVENKISAGDQPNQLERYYTYVRDILRIPENQIRLLYLSPHGGKPTIPHSISPDLYDELIMKGILREASYRNDIADWLTQCKDKLSYQGALYHSLLQYINTIKTL